MLLAIIGKLTKPAPGWGELGWAIFGFYLLAATLIAASLTAVTAIVLGSIAAHRIRRRQHNLTGRRMALSAVWIGAISLVLPWVTLAVSIQKLNSSARTRIMTRVAPAPVSTYTAIMEDAARQGKFAAKLDQISCVGPSKQRVYLGKGFRQNMPNRMHRSATKSF